MENICIERLSKEEIKNRGISSWPVWEKGVSRFEHSYSATEECFIIEGAFTIETPERNYRIEKGDFVTFKKNLKCIWDIKSAVKKYYNFP